MGFFDSIVGRASFGLIGGTEVRVQATPLNPTSTDFSTYDTDTNQGFLSSQEFSNYINSQGSMNAAVISKTYNDLDKDQDGQLSEEEFLDLKNQKVNVGIARQEGTSLPPDPVTDPTGMATMFSLF